ncbi:hypothetical protein DdX_02868 [Ditylenchus destructor]|uniref:Secreted protein n=1 Tax=Ditylenchus destructor TaxID=166010 RepID=A0AAD4RCA6_9BILA|nr:hypothetical protein DdX_02868 [Ditylenchus destructor]
MNWLLVVAAATTLLQISLVDASCCGCCGCCGCCQCCCCPQPPIIIQPPPAIHKICHVPCCCCKPCCCCCGCGGGGKRKRRSIEESPAAYRSILQRKRREAVHFINCQQQAFLSQKLNPSNTSIILPLSSPSAVPHASVINSTSTTLPSRLVRGVRSLFGSEIHEDKDHHGVGLKRIVTTKQTVNSLNSNRCKC